MSREINLTSTPPEQATVSEYLRKCIGLIVSLAKGAEDAQKDLLIEAFEIVLGPIKSFPRPGLQRYHDLWLPFEKRLRADAHESAAMMLVPEGEGYELIHKIGAQTTGFVTCGSKIEWGDRHCIAAKTPAMALAAAAVQAHAVRTLEENPEHVLFEIANALEAE